MDQRVVAWDKWPFLRSDQAFDQFYPAAICKLSEMHWTPLDVKFCTAVGLLHPEAVCYGIEQRQQLCVAAEQVRKKTGAYNVRLRHGNITALDGADYDHFYYYNAFCEQIQPRGRIDSTVPVSLASYRQYQAHFYYLLLEKPASTKPVTYDTPNAEVPAGYKLAKNTYKKCLKFWVKEG